MRPNYKQVNNSIKMLSENLKCHATEAAGEMLLIFFRMVASIWRMMFKEDWLFTLQTAF